MTPLGKVGHFSSEEKVILSTEGEQIHTAIVPITLGHGTTPVNL